MPFPRAGHVSDDSEEMVSDTDSSVGSVVVAAVAQESFMEGAQANVAATLAQMQLNNLSAQLPGLAAPGSQQPLGPHAQVMRTILTVLTVYKSC